MTIAVEAKRDFKDRLYAEFARVGKAASSPHRLELLDLLAQGERTVESLATETGLSVANTSHHLQLLRRARLVAARRDGLFVRYRLSGPDVTALVVALRQTAEQHLAEVDRVVRDFFGDSRSLEPVTPDELVQRMARHDVVLLDVRPEQEYASGHIAGALSMPVADIANRLAELPDGKEFIAYCRGPYCIYADEAVTVLQAHGRRARRLTEGYPEWRLAGRPVTAALPRDRHERRPR